MENGYCQKQKEELSSDSFKKITAVDAVGYLQRECNRLRAVIKELLNETELKKLKKNVSHVLKMNNDLVKKNRKLKSQIHILESKIK